VVKRRWQARALIAFVAAMGGSLMLAQACGGSALLVGCASEEFAAFLGISLEQLEPELSAQGARPPSVAEARGRTREELKTFFVEQVQTNLSEAVADGTMPQEDADNMFEGLASRIDDIIEMNDGVSLRSTSRLPIDEGGPT
jgi:hypothetical protein